LTISTAATGLRTRIATAYPALVAAIAVIDFTLSLVAVAGLFAGRWVVGLYLAHSTQPSAYGAASSFAALLLWLYYTSQIFLFGAEFTSCLAGLRPERDREIDIASPSARTRLRPRSAPSHEAPGSESVGPG
jgi:membrane protein